MTRSKSYKLALIRFIETVSLPVSNEEFECIVELVESYKLAKYVEADIKSSTQKDLNKNE